MGTLSNKGGRGQRNRQEMGAGATFIFLARISRLRRSCARLDKAAMLRRLPDLLSEETPCGSVLVNDHQLFAFWVFGYEIP